MKYHHFLLLATFAFTGCVHQVASSPDALEGPSEFVFRSYPDGTTYRTEAQDDAFARYTEVSDGRTTFTKNEAVRYQTGFQVVKLTNGCFKTTSRRIGSKEVHAVMTLTKPPTPVNNTEPVLKIETVPIDCAAYFGG
jgi:hypothetical protein